MDGASGWGVAPIAPTPPTLWRIVTSSSHPQPSGPAGATIELRPGIRLTHARSLVTGRVTEVDGAHLVLERRDGRTRRFPVTDRYLVDLRPVTLVTPQAARPAATAGISASGARVDAGAAKVARPDRIWVEGIHDAELVEKVWGAELRDLAIVVEPLGGIDDLPAQIRSFAPGPGRRLGVLVDHLVSGSKEQRLAAQVTSPHVLITGHPFVDVWAAVRPHVAGIDAWPDVPKGTPWKEGVAAALGVADHRDVWRRALTGVRSYADLDVGLVGAVERLLDFLTADDA